jgi:hypothetical protein
MPQESRNDRAFRTAEAFLEKPLIWANGQPTASGNPTFDFVAFRLFHRGVRIYGATLLLLKAGQWEDAMILLRSIYELSLNLAQLSRSPDLQEGANRFIRFGKFEQARLEERRLKDQLASECDKTEPSKDAIENLEKAVEATIAAWQTEFSDFSFTDRKGRQRWESSWSRTDTANRAQNQCSRGRCW